MAASPLLGYNTNVRHLGKLYHIQTEDSGTGHGHIFTHLFADGGRIIASKKTTYAQYIDTTHYPGNVKQLMRESHKAIFIALRDGLFDEDEAEGAKKVAEMTIQLPAETAPAAVAAQPAVTTSSPGMDIEALERAAAERLAEAQEAQSVAPPAVAARASGRYAPTQPAAVTRRSSAPVRPDPGTESIFGGDLLSEKSLDEVILSYLAEDVEDDA